MVRVSVRPKKMNWLVTDGADMIFTVTHHFPTTTDRNDGH